MREYKKNNVFFPTHKPIYALILLLLLLICSTQAASSYSKQNTMCVYIGHVNEWHTVQTCIFPLTSTLSAQKPLQIQEKHWESFFSFFLARWLYSQNLKQENINIFSFFHLITKTVFLTVAFSVAFIFQSVNWYWNSSLDEIFHSLYLTLTSVDLLAIKESWTKVRLPLSLRK